jgi:hypothetical protein
VARRANSVEGFYAGDISSKAFGRSKQGFALNASTRTLRRSNLQEKLGSLALIAELPFVLRRLGISKTLSRNRRPLIWHVKLGIMFPEFSWEERRPHHER